MSGQYLGLPELTGKCFQSKLGSRHILRTAKTTKLKLSQESPLGTCS